MPRSSTHGTSLSHVYIMPPAHEPLHSYLEDENDIKTLVRGMRILDDIAKTEPLASRLDPKGNSCPDLEHDLSKKTDAELADFVRNNVQTLYHPTSTARMAPLEDGGVLDPQLRVHGIPNLRVADASSYPSIVAGHTVSCFFVFLGSTFAHGRAHQTAPVYAIAEKASDLIKNDVGQRSTRI